MDKPRQKKSLDVTGHLFNENSWIGKKRLCVRIVLFYGLEEIIFSCFIIALITDNLLIVEKREMPL